MIKCPYCYSTKWQQTHKDILDPKDDTFQCHNCNRKFQRYDKPTLPRAPDLLDAIQRQDPELTCLVLEGMISDIIEDGHEADEFTLNLVEELHTSWGITGG